MAFKVWLQYGCSQPSSSIIVFYIVLVWGFQAEFIAFNMFFRSSCAGVYKINLFWIFNSHDCLISPSGQKGYNVVPVSCFMKHSHCIIILLQLWSCLWMMNWYRFASNWSYITHKICNTLLLQYECSEQQAVGGDVDRYIDAVSGMYKGRYMVGYSQDLGVTAVFAITIITVGVMKVLWLVAITNEMQLSKGIYYSTVH